MPKKEHNKLPQETGFMYYSDKTNPEEYARIWRERGCAVRILEDRVSWFRLSRHNPFPTLKDRDRLTTAD